MIELQKILFANWLESGELSTTTHSKRNTKKFTEVLFTMKDLLGKTWKEMSTKMMENLEPDVIEDKTSVLMLRN